MKKKNYVIPSPKALDELKLAAGGSKGWINRVDKVVALFAHEK